MQQHSHTCTSESVQCKGNGWPQSHTPNQYVYILCASLLFRCYFDFLIKFMGDSVCHICEINLRLTFILFYISFIFGFYSTNRAAVCVCVCVCKRVSFVWLDFFWGYQIRLYAYNLVLEFLIACNSNENDVNGAAFTLVAFVGVCAIWARTKVTLQCSTLSEYTIIDFSYHIHTLELFFTNELFKMAEETKAEHREREQRKKNVCAMHWKCVCVFREWARKPKLSTNKKGTVEQLKLEQLKWITMEQKAKWGESVSTKSNQNHTEMAKGNNNRH